MSAASGTTRIGATRARRVLVAAAIVVFLIVAVRALDAPALLAAGLERIGTLGPWGPVMFVALYMVATVVFIPGSVLTIGGGAVFGFAQGVVAVSAGATLGATAAFLVGRYLARDLVARKVEADPRLRAIDEAVAREGWKIVALVRLSPIFPFALVNYAFGLTRVALRPYVVASWLGMLPGTVMYVMLGAAAGNLATLGEAPHGRPPAQWALAALGLVATVAVTVHITRLARAALDRRLAG